MFLLIMPGVMYSHAQTFMSNGKKGNSDSLNKPQIMLRDLSIPNTIAPDYYTKSFGFFCKQEQKLEKINVPLKVRAGNPDYCNYLESKSNLSPVTK